MIVGYQVESENLWYREYRMPSFGLDILDRCQEIQIDGYYRIRNQIRLVAEEEIWKISCEALVNREVQDEV